MPDPELKPCPRCGGEAQIYVPPNNLDVCGVRCKKCGLGSEGWLSNEPRREAAAAWWNERPVEQQLDPKAEAAYLDGLLRESESTDRSVLKVIWDRRSKVRDCISANDCPAEQGNAAIQQAAGVLSDVVGFSEVVLQCDHHMTSDEWAKLGNDASRAYSALLGKHPAEQAKVVYSIGVERDYDPGLLNDYGGGNVQWWQDYIRVEVERCNGYWRSVFAATEQAKDEPAQCIGNGTEGNGCGNVAGKSGDTCQKCGGMMLSRQALEQAKAVETCGAPSPRSCTWYRDAAGTGNATDEPTHAAEDRPPKQHQCPYGGEHWTESAWVRRRQLCGEQGWLCDRCKQDRADARASAGNRLQAQEEYAAALDARLSNVEIDTETNIKALSRALADAQARLAQAEVRIFNSTKRVEALEARLPGPQTSLQDLGTHNMGSTYPERLPPLPLSQEDLEAAQDEPTQHGEPEDRPPKHECPYGAWRSQYQATVIPCGDEGWLCDRCQQDRADARQQQEHKFLREMTDANVERLRAAAFRYAGERIEEVQLRIDDLSKAMCDRLSVLEARP